jgi:hypothetical protein
MSTRISKAIACLFACAAFLAVAGSAQAAFHLDSFSGGSFAQDGGDEAQAGAHPFRQSVTFELGTTVPDGEGRVWADGNVENTIVDLPPGLVGDPTSLLTCPRSNLGLSACDPGTQVGVITLAGTATAGLGGVLGRTTLPLFNMEPRRGDIADFGFTVLGVNTHILFHLDPARGYALRTVTPDISQALETTGAKVTVWGVPADPSHDPYRGGLGGCIGEEAICGNGASAGVEPVAFLSNPTQCGAPPVFFFAANPWQDPLNFVHGADAMENGITGCDQLEFDPTIQVRPTTDLANAPSGLEFALHIPQNEDPEGLTTAHMRDISVTLPEGMTLNPSSADGLGACSLDQLGMSVSGVPNGDLDRCPDNSKLGTVEAVSPAISHPLNGSIYLAAQNANPFNSLVGLYLVLEDPETGIRIKLAGRVETDPATGRVTTIFRDQPQQPLEDLKLTFKQGPRAALKTPEGCGTYETTASIVPWSAPEGATANRSAKFALGKGPGGGACPATGSGAPNAPAFNAGTLDPSAATFTPFLLNLNRGDGSQQFKTIDMTLPKGLLAKLAGTPYCPDSALAAAAGRSGKAEQSSASCPAASQIGSATTGVGVGSAPLYVGGKIYLAGPYKGAPLSMAIVTPSVTGPFDLGNVVVRTALNIDPETAEVHAVSDPLPRILQGFPLNIRSVALKLDKPGFILNPSNCNPSAISGALVSIYDQSASLNNPFQVGECGRLGFKPKLAIKLKGGTKRGDNPALTALLDTRGTDANIARTVVALPHSEFLAQNHIKTICTRVQFAADACPAGSIYGKATAWTPLLDQPLTGPVYLRSSSNKLPDLVVSLNGQIDVDLVGRIDSVNAGIRTSFESVPDAPVSKFLLQMQGGKKSLLENSRNLCASTSKASVQMDAHNGRTNDFPSVVKAKGCKGKAKKKKSKHRGAKSKSNKG